jgi:glucose-fructose oxidoreductase
VVGAPFPGRPSISFLYFFLFAIRGRALRTSLPDKRIDRIRDQDACRAGRERSLGKEPSMAKEGDGGVSRRGFLRLAGGALAAPLASGGPELLAQVPDVPLPELPGKKVGWAIVGLGQLSINQILPAFARCKKSRVTALVSGRPPKAQHLAQVYGVDAKNIYDYDDFDTIAKNPGIEAVYVVLPNSMHAEYTIRALKAGKHVLCEKPMATTVQDCEAMIEAARAASRKLMIGYRLRYEPFNQALIKFSRDPAELGPTRVILADAGFNIGDPKQWRLRRKMAGGGSLMDIGIYALQAARYLSGEEPAEVSAMIHSTPGDERFVEVEENVTFHLRFPSGILANCTSSYGVPVNRFRAVKPRGWAELEPALSYSGLRMRVFRGALEERPQPVVDHFAAEMDHFSECVTAGRDPLTPGEEGLHDLRVMMAIYEAAQSGRTVKLTS